MLIELSSWTLKEVINDPVTKNPTGDYKIEFEFSDGNKLTEIIQFGTIENQADLSNRVREYAKAYLAGKAQEEEQKITIPKGLKVGEKQEVK